MNFPDEGLHRLIGDAHTRPASSARWRLAPHAWMVFWLFMMTNPLERLVKGIPPSAATLTDPSTNRVIYSNVWLQQGLKAAVLGAFCLVIATRWRLFPVIVRRAPLPFLFLAYAIVSLGWSDTPSNSVTDLIYLVTALAAGCALAVRFSAGEIARIIGWTGFAIGILSLATIIALPAYGVHGAAESLQGDLAGAWRGVYLQKNILGQIMAIFVPAFLLCGRQLFGSRWLQVAATGLALGEVVASRSSAALVVLVLGTAAALVLFRLRGIVRLVLLFLLPLFGLIALSSYEAVLASLGKRADLSGRTEIWDAAFRVIAARPLFGYGYGSASMGGLTAYVISRFKAQNTHNGFLDLALATGVVGSMLLYAGIALALVSAARAFPRDAAHRLLVVTATTYVCGWLVGAMSEVALRPNVPMGALGLVLLVVLSALPPAEARRGFST